MNINKKHAPSPPLGAGGKYKHLFFDLDHTLWDFEANARLTLETLYEDLSLQERGVHDFTLFYKNYLVHNDHLWEHYRKGLIKQDELRIKRMRLALLDFKIADEELSEKMNVQFLDLLPTRNILFPHTKEILQYLVDKNYELHLITNGFETVQHNKLKYSGLAGFFKEVITSEGSNSIKPNKEIFEYAFQKTNANPATSIMIGDTIEVDIVGAMNAGIDQVFVNHIGITTDVKPTYTVSSLKELESIF
ncbi:YjjG family noncanonical pyrimidine nucleotidase [Terrimonas pollutisoli]|uniref:YjjG family noncanonical pyrimidine nucleotidase n=1 Tax=Terrimonas pollutisoli TaxID=3034147 RepID=UPI0023ED200C|nr:YjjG family noncanonical pyrimidine nucleotidase [Terrimonas sp. H1YJ31]